MLDPRGRVVLVSFSLGKLTELTRAELEVVRWAHAGYSNGAIGLARNTASHTVARQMAEAMRKLGISARLCLSLMPELSAWSPAGPEARAPGAPVRSLPRGKGLEIDPCEAARIWREIASGQWETLAGVDAGGMRHAVLSRDSTQSIDWRALSKVHRDVLALTARGLPQKAVALKLGLAPSTISGALQAAHKRLGFASLGQLLRAYCAYEDVIGV
jgi:DNA-binding NarL/FixJ family response regulator